MSALPAPALGPLSRPRWGLGDLGLVAGHTRRAVRGGGLLGLDGRHGFARFALPGGGRERLKVVQPGVPLEDAASSSSRPQDRGYPESPGGESDQPPVVIA